MYGQKTIINDCLMIDTLNTFLLPDYAFSIDCCYLPIKFTIAPWNKRNLDTTDGGWIVLNKVWSYRGKSGVDFES